MNAQINQKKAYMYGFMAVILWSTVASAFKITLLYFTPEQLLFYSVCFSLIILFVSIVKDKKIQLLFSYTKRDYIKLMILGIINPFLYYLILFKAYDLLPAQVAQPINYTWALTLSYLSFFILKQKLTLYDFLAGIICYIGILIISTRGDIFSFQLSSTLGVILAFSSTILWSLYWIYNTKSDVDLIISLFISFLSGFAMIILYMFLFSKSFEINLYGIWGSAYIGFLKWELLIYFG